MSVEQPWVLGIGLYLCAVVGTATSHANGQTLGHFRKNEWWLPFLALSGFVAGLLLIGQPEIGVSLVILATAMGFLFLLGLEADQPANAMAAAVYAIPMAILGGLIAPSVAVVAAIGTGALAFFYAKYIFASRVGDYLTRNVGSALVGVSLSAGRALPWHRERLFSYCRDALLLKESRGEHEFIHRQLRDYFALLPIVSILQTDEAARHALTQRLTTLKDASCDVLLELIEDDDKKVREACISGLGKIGSVVSAQTLLEIIRRTGPGLQAPATKALENIRDFAATPLLVAAVRNEKTPRSVRISAVVALAEMDQLEALENRELLASLRDEFRRSVSDNNQLFNFDLGLVRLGQSDIAFLDQISNYSHFLHGDRFRLLVTILTKINSDLAIPFFLKFCGTYQIFNRSMKVQSRKTIEILNMPTPTSVLKPEEVARYLVDKNDRIRAGALTVLRELEPERLIPFLPKLVIDADQNIRAISNDMLSDFRPNKVIPQALNAILENPTFTAMS